MHLGYPFGRFPGVRPAKRKVRFPPLLPFRPFAVVHRASNLTGSYRSGKLPVRKRPLADIPGQLQTRLMRASTALALLALASCKVAPLARQAGDQSQRSDEREITGVLTLYTEGETFRQCPLREPWNCFKAKGPECGFDATPEARTLINTEITKSGATQKYATFGIVMIGTRLDGVHAGHLSGYSCEFHARSVLDVKEVASAPPDTSNAVSVR